MYLGSRSLQYGVTEYKPRDGALSNKQSIFFPISCTSTQYKFAAVDTQREDMRTEGSDESHLQQQGAMKHREGKETEPEVLIERGDGEE